MSWVKLDDQFFMHRKVIGLSKDAKLLYLAAMAYCGAQSPKGILTPAAVRLAAATVEAKPSCAHDLVRVGLWEKREDGSYQIHDYNEYNPTPEQQEARRKAAAERQSRYKKSHSNAVSNTVPNATDNGDGNDVTPRGRAGSPSPSPIPDPESVSTTQQQHEGGAGETKPTKEPPAEDAAAGDLVEEVRSLSDTDLLERARRDYPAEDFPDFWDRVNRRLKRATSNPHGYCRACILEQYAKRPPGDRASPPPAVASPSARRFPPPTPEERAVLESRYQRLPAGGRPQ